MKAKSLSFLAISFGAAYILSSLPFAVAKAATVPSPAKEGLELSLLAPNAAVKNGVITASNISQKQLTIPSIWWAKEQFGAMVLDNWLAYPTDGANAARVDLVVNQQNWSLLDYLERYEFVNHFGSVARDYGYNVRVFNHQKELLATYTCDFSNNPRLCNIGKLDATGKAGLRGSR